LFVVSSKKRKIQPNIEIMSTQTNNGYILLFRGNQWYNDLAPEELRNVMDQCKAWFDRLTAEGKFKAGQPLVREGATVSGKNGRFVSDGPFAESKEAIGGFMMLQADSIEEAIAVAKGNPTLAYGTTIEVRPVAEECPMNVRARQIGLEKQLAVA
jgi:hypothetical protein